MLRTMVLMGVSSSRNEFKIWFQACDLWFTCENCDFKTSEKFYLKTHIQYQHEGMVFYKCDQCTYRSLKKTNFEKHKLETVHKNVREKVPQMQQL